MSTYRGRVTRSSSSASSSASITDVDEAYHQDEQFPNGFGNRKEIEDMIDAQKNILRDVDKAREAGEDIGAKIMRRSDRIKQQISIASSGRDAESEEFRRTMTRVSKKLKSRTVPGSKTALLAVLNSVSRDFMAGCKKALNAKVVSFNDYQGLMRLCFKDKWTLKRNRKTRLTKATREELIESDILKQED